MIGARTIAVKNPAMEIVISSLSNKKEFHLPESPVFLDRPKVCTENQQWKEDSTRSPEPKQKAEKKNLATNNNNIVETSKVCPVIREIIACPPAKIEGSV